MNCNDRLQKEGLIKGVNHKKGKIQDTHKKKELSWHSPVAKCLYMYFIIRYQGSKSSLGGEIFNFKDEGCFSCRGVFGRKISFNEV